MYKNDDEASKVSFYVLNQEMKIRYLKESLAVLFLLCKSVIYIIRLAMTFIELEKKESETFNWMGESRKAIQNVE